MDPTTAHKLELTLNSNSASQTINVANGHGDSDERIPAAFDDGASDDDAAVATASRNLRYRASQMKTLGLRTRESTWACPFHQRTLVRATQS
jgi:hypothetical protein